MKNDLKHKAECICAADIAALAKAGVARAVAARDEALVELSPQQVTDVGGGFALSLKAVGPLIYGGRPPLIDRFADLEQLGGMEVPQMF